MRFTQRQINLMLLGLMTLGGLTEFALFALQDVSSQRTIGYGVGAAAAGGALVAYLRGWERARYLVIVVVVLLIGVFLEGEFLTTRVAMEVFLPPVIALILAEPPWVLGAGATTIAIIAVRSGGQSTYLAVDNLVIYAVLVGGMVLSRLAVDTAQRLAVANARADAARRDAEARAQELGRRNDDLQRLLSENAQQRDLIHELSVPILPLTDSALILPLVGALDSARLLHAQERALNAVYTMGARLLIVDVSGVLLIDTQVARGLVAMVQAVRLLGVDVALVGIRGEVAHTIVGLGLDLGALAIFRDVRSVLQNRQLSHTL
jgi:rsbT co-antagonist protein RsbR